MNLANKLTFLRIIISFVFMGLLYSDNLFLRIAALFLFIIAMLTDFFDGMIARQRGMITNLGKLLDPLADKILVTVAFISFVELALVPAWMVVLIISREFCVTGLRLIASSKGKIIAAYNVGKHKTVSQMVVIVLILIVLVSKSLLVKLDISADNLLLFAKWSYNIIQFSMIVTVGLTLISGYVCIKENLSLFEEEK
jgi:CDP-diacylglycerol--glycerol-3-phosphate 3-phosphatidyltransferase